MRTPKAISPTSLQLFEKDREEFYLRYLADAKKPRAPQTDAMSVGSSFDAFVKCALHHDLYGNDGDGEFDLDKLFDLQVEEGCRPFARRAGEHCFRVYKKYGGYADLLKALEVSDKPPRFEFTLEGEIEGIPLLGKPDLWYTIPGCQIVFDWKVNGYCSKHGTSPKKLFAKCRDCWDGTPTRGYKDGPKAHPKYKEIEFCGLKIGEHSLDDVDTTWADQLTIYSWLLGAPVGEGKIVTFLDQLACTPGTVEPKVRLAQHRCRVSSFWQHSLLKRLHVCWDAISSGHIFTELSREDSDSKCETLEIVAAAPSNEMFDDLCMEPYRG